MTLAPIPLASGSWAKALIAAVNLLPFCNRVAFSVAEVLELKNFSQFAVICATAAAELLAAGDETDAELTGALEAEAEEAAVEADVLELLLQAVTARARARASVGARAIRRAKRLNRMTRLLSLGRSTAENAAIPGTTECLLASLHRMFPKMRLVTRRWPTCASG